jgi:hypothetical protein
MPVTAAAINTYLAPAPRAGLTIGKLRELIRDLPENMDVRLFASIDSEECHVLFAETYKSEDGGTLMLSDTDSDGAGATVIFDRTGE